MKAFKRKGNLADIAGVITPADVTHMFQLSEQGVSMKDIHTHMNAAKGVDWFTDQCVRAALHRRAPFDNPRWFVGVGDELGARVFNKFHKKARVYKNAISDQPLLHGADEPKATPAQPGLRLNNTEMSLQTAQILVKALTAKMAYDEALHEASALGFSEESVRAWISMAANGDLQ